MIYHTDVYTVSTDDEDTQRERDSKMSIPSSSKPTLSDIYERSEEDKDSEKKLSRHSRRGDVEMTSTEPEIKQFPLRRSKPVALSVENLEKFDSKLASKESPNTGLKGPGPREVSFGEIKKERTSVTQGSDRPRVTQGSMRTGSFVTEPVPGTGWRVEVGSDLPEGRASEASSVPTYTNLPVRTPEEWITDDNFHFRSIYMPHVNFTGKEHSHELPMKLLYGTHFTRIS